MSRVTHLPGELAGRELKSRRQQADDIVYLRGQNVRQIKIDLGVDAIADSQQHHAKASRCSLAVSVENPNSGTLT